MLACAVYCFVIINTISLFVIGYSLHFTSFAGCSFVNKHTLIENYTQLTSARCTFLFLRWKLILGGQFILLLLRYFVFFMPQRRKIVGGSPVAVLRMTARPLNDLTPETAGIC